MAAIQLTLFNATENPKKAKHALSKYKDESFTFVTVEFPNLVSAYQFITKEFVLSQPLNLNIREPKNIVRDKESLSPFKYEKLKNIILDLDKITTAQDYLDTIDYFKNKNYSCILGKSRSNNGKTNFNMKGIIRVDIENNEEVIKAVLTQLQIELGDKCKIDLSMAQVASYQAPTHSKMMVYTNENGKKLSSTDLYISDVNDILNKKPKDIIEVKYDNELIDECISIFASLGYTPIRNSLNENGAINFQHPVEKKSIGSFFWYNTQPIVMHHPNKDRTVSIFNILKDTEIGRKWLKKKTKTEQKHQLIKNNIYKYKSYDCFNERYLDFEDENKIQIMNNFLDTDKGILKIKSAMGTAKSNGVDLCIKEAHKRNLKVILISNRISVAKDFTEKYDLMWYKDTDAWKQENSIVVQFDSLHRFDISKFDVVILDEFVSLLFHHRSNLTSNSNINVVKFKIFMETKKVLAADAFLTGCEDIFFGKRDIFMIDNDYRDNIELFEHKNKENFIKTILDESKKLKDGKKITASFTSNNIMKATHFELLKMGVKCIMLNAETPEHTRQLIYKRFKEFNHNSFDVLLFSPTLTVGVSNLNDVDKHFHFDSGMSTDVISSLQMIKRSRTTKEIHFFLEERQFYFDTDVHSINSVAETNINTFYNNKNSTLLIDVDYNTGKLKLTQLGKYVNKIEAFFNVTKNNHAHAFKLLLEHQFDTSMDDLKIIEHEETNFNLKETIKTIKEIEKNHKLKILKDYENKDFSSIDIERLKTKTIELTDIEKIELIIGEIKTKFKKEISSEDLNIVATKEIENNFKYFSMISKLRTTKKIFNSRDYAKYLLSQTISSDISSLQNKSYTNFLEYVSLISSNTTLKKSYSENEIKIMDEHYKVGNKFKKFIKSIGYIKKKGDAKFRLDEDVLRFSKLL